MLINVNRQGYIINNYIKDKEVSFVGCIEGEIDINSNIYKFIYGDVIVEREINLLDKKEYKLNQLEEYISKVKETGVEYNGKWFKCDDECKNNITQSMLFIDSLLPLTWFTRNGEQGTVTFTTREEFMAFVQVIAGKLAEIQNSYYAYKYAIEQAQTEEELNAIVFGGGSNDTQEE